MRAALTFIAALAATPATAQAVPDMVLTPGRMVTISFDDGNRPTRSEGAAQWTPYLVHAARELSGTTPPDAPQTEPVAIAQGPQQDRPVTGQVRVRLLSIAGRHTIMAVENGLPTALRFRARMTLRGQQRATDVCIVQPRLPSYEHWPHEIDRIELYGFETVPWRPGDRVTCE